ncbi:ubiquitin hydrolase [Verticillium dahliae]
MTGFHSCPPQPVCLCWPFATTSPPLNILSSFVQHPAKRRQNNDALAPLRIPLATGFHVSHHHQTPPSMNSQRSQSSYLYKNPDALRSPYTLDTIRDRIYEPTFLISLAALFVTTVLLTTSLRGGALWDALAHVLPYRLLYVLENWLRPPLAPRPMLQGPARTHAVKSDMMQKILGMDRPGGGIMNTVSQAGQRGLTSMSGAMMAFKADSESPPGLGNLDNSCYQNSILQGLASLKPLPRYLSEQLRDADLDRRRYDATVTLRGLIADLNSVENNGRTLWTPSSLKNMSTWQQQDAQEYFSKLLDEIDKEIAKAGMRKNSLPSLDTSATAAAAPTAASAPDDTNVSQHSDDSGYQSVSTLSRATSAVKLARNPLEGLVAQRVACVQCGHSDGLAMIPFNCLTLSLGLNSAEHDLYELLDAYANIESIEGVECGKCTLLKVRKLLNILIERNPGTGSEMPRSRLAAVEEAFENDDFEDKTITEKCKVSASHKVTSTKTKQTVIARPPQSLAIHMNRSAFDENTGHMWKNGAAVRFPPTLDLGPWCLGSAGTYARVTPDEEPGTSGASGRGLPQVKPARPDEEEWLLNPRSSMVAGDKGQSKMTGPLYELQAVVTHFGRHENGHYICYRKFPRSSPPTQVAPTKHMDADGGMELKPIAIEQAGTQEAEAAAQDEEVEMDWWRLSDETVRKVDEDHVLSQGGVFMLFYDCVDARSVLTSQADAEADAEADGPQAEDESTALADRAVPAAKAPEQAAPFKTGGAAEGPEGEPSAADLPRGGATDASPDAPAALSVGGSGQCQP